MKQFSYFALLIGLLFVFSFCSQQGNYPRKKSIYYFYLDSCPACINYSLTINKLIEDSKDKFEWIWINCDLQNPVCLNQNSNTKMQKKFHISEIKLPYIPEIAPSVLIVDENKKILYKGAIDNWYYDIGKHRRKATEHFLKNAILSISQNQFDFIKETKPIGCYIEKE